MPAVTVLFARAERWNPRKRIRTSTALTPMASCSSSIIKKGACEHAEGVLVREAQSEDS
jgi:hypothetical protein